LIEPLIELVEIPVIEPVEIRPPLIELVEIRPR
jgi:hypothetical protein